MSCRVSLTVCFAFLVFVQGEEGAPVQTAVDAYKKIEFLRRGDTFLPTRANSGRNLQEKRQQSDIQTNEIEAEIGERPSVHVFDTFNAPLPYQQQTRAKPLFEIRKKRELEDPETILVGKIRNKRTHCRKCRGGYTTYEVIPVYIRPSYGGGGGGCNICGGGGFGGGGGFSGSFSSSFSSSHSSSGSFGYGK